MEQQAAAFICCSGHCHSLSSLYRGYIRPTFPNMISAQEKQVMLDSTSSWLFSKSKIGKQYGGFRKFITEKEAYKAGGYPIPKRFRKKNGIIVQADSNFYSFKKFPAGVRAAFYVNWDPRSFTSLEQNISRLNMVVPGMAVSESECRYAGRQNGHEGIRHHE